MKPLRWYDHLSINLFWLGLNIRNTAIGSIFMPYLVAGFVSGDVMNTALGAMRTAGLVIAMLVQPAMGLLSDRSMSRFGRRRPFIFAGTLFDLLFLAAIGLAGGYWALLIAILLQQFSANVSHGPLQGLIPDLVPEDQRGRSSGVKAIFELLPLILVAFTVAKLVAAKQVGWAIFATGAGLLVTMLLTMLLVKEEPLREKPNTPLGPPMLRVLGVLAGIGVGAAAGLLGGGVIGGLAGLIAWPAAGAVTARAIGLGVGGLIAMVVAVVVGVWAGAIGTLGRQDAREHAPFTWWVVNRLLFLAAATSIQGFAPYFLMYAFKMTREAAADLTGSLMMVVGVCTLLTALPGGWLADRMGHKRLVGISGLVAAVAAFLLLGAIWVPNLSLIYVAGITLGLATGLFMTTNWALGTRLVPSAEAGRYLGISNLAGAGAGMIGSGIGGPLADTLNRVTPGLGYAAIFACYGVLFVLSTVSLRWVKTKS
ncbi:MAG: MFS transporter [Chloroflexi bacterium]|nr:MFS transporter [Chloroflexota bacterium]